ncbi:MAG TPA: glutamine--tRNA ligase/YqeY domain fusion protein [Beggiatoa sp.]|nr:MAG: glutamine--tRNA ligase [Beggiatoa sp. 4572_84]RKZ54998.1 MAG: glutamine--tRNA ligase [Gammaproteobacteria bacterium]HEW97913.1 glutamine--tRNA ligase/YqeY domain fusion protein [Beggiatoa sp.]
MTAPSANTTEASLQNDFIRQIIADDIKANKNDGRVVTRFPPEPNGYLHIGHAKSICLNFGIAAEQEGRQCYLRFDDTNPSKESVEYVESIKTDVHWLGYDWEDRLRHSSDYFDQLYEYAVALIKMGKAYVCSLTAEQIKGYRGTLREQGKNSPYRDRSIEENIDLFERMKAGEFADGEQVLRAKIDMASPNLNLRDPTIYRIKKVPHQMTGDKWCIYPMYDFTHCLSDAIEGITHSLCTLEFEDHRPLYDWFLDTLKTACHPQQIEFARLSLNYTVMSKRKLQELVENQHVNGWDDPRMPTLSGMRRRGYTPEAIREFCDRIGVTKNDTHIEMGVLENCIRSDLDPKTVRVMAVLKPLRVVIENYPEGQVEQLEAPYHPNDASMGSRQVPFSRVLYLEQDDFREVPPKKFFRLAPGREVRLRYAYFITCQAVIKNEQGEIVELRCTYDPETRGGSAPDGRKVKGTLHWVSEPHAITAEIRLYDRLFNQPNPGAGGIDFKAALNPNSMEILTNSQVEPSLANAVAGIRYQFERQGYFCVDSVDGLEGALVFNRIVTLRDSWAKIEKANYKDSL